MPDMNDFHAFKSTSGNGGDSGGGGGGCLKPILIIGIIVLVLCLIGQCAG